MFGLLCAVFLLSILPGSTLSAEEIIYGHISLVDIGATVIRQDGTENSASVNLPIVPGDQIITGEKGRCELQFDNGTVIRLDENSRLKVTTVLAPMITSSKKITTLHLLKGQVYSMPQSYNREIFQVITPNAAFYLTKRSSSIIRYSDNGDTTVNAISSSFSVLYGANIDSVKREKIKSGKTYIITKDNRLVVSDEKPGMEFLGWNEHVNKNFDDLHFGISKVPPILNSFKNRSIRYFAEKWASLYGEWIYDEVFGYVWKPADDLFKYSSRPFFNATQVTINGKLFLVPQQKWGWAPAHMGTWVWMKGGWTWVPSDAFHSGIMGISSQYPRYMGYYAFGFYNRWMFPYGDYGFYPFDNSFYYCTLDYLLNGFYGGYDLYRVYRIDGPGRWASEYAKVYGVNPKEPKLDKLPAFAKDIMKKIENAPLQSIKDHLAAPQKTVVFIKDAAQSFHESDKFKSVTYNSQKKEILSFTNGKSEVSNTAISRNAISEKLAEKKGQNTGFRDWNPDVRWANLKGIDVKYSSERNSVECPKLSISSSTITPIERITILSAGNRIRGGEFNSFQTGGSQNTSNTSTSGSSGLLSISSFTNHSSSSGNGGGNNHSGGPDKKQ